MPFCLITSKGSGSWIKKISIIFSQGYKVWSKLNYNKAYFSSFLEKVLHQNNVWSSQSRIIDKDLGLSSTPRPLRNGQQQLSLMKIPQVRVLNVNEVGNIMTTRWITGSPLDQQIPWRRSGFWLQESTTRCVREKTLSDQGKEKCASFTGQGQEYFTFYYPLWFFYVLLCEALST